MQHVSISKDKNFREALKPIARFLRFTNLLLYMLVLKINYNDFSNNDRETLTSRKTASIFLSVNDNSSILIAVYRSIRHIANCKSTTIL